MGGASLKWVCLWEELLVVLSLVHGTFDMLGACVRGEGGERERGSEEVNDVHTVGRVLIASIY